MTPEQVGSIIIKHLKKYVEKKYDSRIDQAIIAVPAEFDQAERNATSVAAKLAGNQIIFLLVCSC